MPQALGDCNGCYACCCYCGSPPFRNDAERASLPPALGAELAAYYAELAGAVGLSREAQRLPCSWLDEQNRTCLHYAHRPPICREFEVGGPQCQQFIVLGVGTL